MGNFIAYNVGWFAVILGAARGMPWFGTLIALACVAWHVSQATRPRAELALVGVAAAVGVAFDSTLLQLGWIDYRNGMLVPDTAPHWMVALWMQFATTLNLSLAWLKRSLWLAALLGGIGGPLAYAAGAALGAVAIDPAHTFAAYAYLAIGWAVLTPALVHLARRWNGFVALAPSPA